MSGLIRWRSFETGLLSGTVPAAARSALTRRADSRRPAIAAGHCCWPRLWRPSSWPTIYKGAGGAGIGAKCSGSWPPFRSFVAEAPVRAGQRVARGELLARLDYRDLLIEQARQASELAQQERKLAEAVACHDRAGAVVLGAQLAETEARLAQGAQRLRRTRIEAPFDGVVVAGDRS